MEAARLSTKKKGKTLHFASLNCFKMNKIVLPNLTKAVKNIKIQPVPKVGGGGGGSNWEVCMYFYT